MNSISINGQFISIDDQYSIDLGCNVTASVVLQDKLIVVLNWREHETRNENVQCYNSEGKLLWTITPGNWPEDGDCPVTGIWFTNNKLMVYRICGFEQEIDVETGAELNCDFTK